MNRTPIPRGNDPSREAVSTRYLHCWGETLHLRLAVVVVFVGAAERGKWRGRKTRRAGGVPRNPPIVWSRDGG